MRPASALRRSPGPRCACRRGRGGGVVPAAGGRGWFLGVSGFRWGCPAFFFGFVPVCAVSVSCRAAVRALGRRAGRVGAGVGRGAGGRGLAPVVPARLWSSARVAGGCVGVRCCVVGLVRFPGRGFGACGRGVRRLGSGVAVPPSLRLPVPRRAPGSRCVGGRLVAVAAAAGSVACVGGCRWRLLCVAALAVSPCVVPRRRWRRLFAAALRSSGCRPSGAGRRGSRWCRYCSFRVAPLSRRSCSFAGPPACSGPALDPFLPSRAGFLTTRQ
ncbi:MAG: hypothetical protein IPK63_23670 [Candidatus Competibacteraceae bacterium]|nr:hypothetical protein [Candidatus Competibacteraceae bacterium]